MEGMNAQIICSFLVPEGMSDDDMEIWFRNLICRQDGEVLKDLLFLYETNAIVLTYDEHAHGRSLLIGRPIQDEDDPAYD